MTFQARAGGQDFPYSLPQERIEGKKSGKEGWGRRRANAVSTLLCNLPVLPTRTSAQLHWSILGGHTKGAPAYPGSLHSLLGQNPAASLRFSLLLPIGLLPVCVAILATLVSTSVTCAQCSPAFTSQDQVHVFSLSVNF